MTHMKPMAESEGELTRGCGEKHYCPKCKQTEALCYLWESSDGAYEDYKYECQKCHYVRWVDGIDS